jgi:predicted NACHT family NTPase
MKNSTLEFRYSPSAESEYGTLDYKKSVDMILNYLKKNKINNLYSLAGISHYNNLFGLDMTETYADEEEFVDEYQTDPIFYKNNWISKALKLDNIYMEILFLTEKALTKYI